MTAGARYNEDVPKVTFLPVGGCLTGYGGALIAEASAVACCCAQPTGTTHSTWGRVKSIYR